MSHFLPTFNVDVSNFALLNYRIPADRVREHLPSEYDLQTFDGECFVSATCFCNGDFRPYGLPAPRMTFTESTFRTYVTHKGRAGVYFFGRYVSRLIPPVTQRVLAAHTYKAEFDIGIDMSSNGYTSYTCTASSSKGLAAFSLAASDAPITKEPFSSGEEMAQFFTYRLHGFFTSSLGIQGHMPVMHPHMKPFAGVLSAARLDLFAELGIVSAEEAGTPFSVLVERGIPFTLYAPRPLT